MSMDEYRQFSNLKHGTNFGVGANNKTAQNSNINIPLDFDEINFQRKHQEIKNNISARKVLKDQQLEKRRHVKKVSAEIAAGVATGILLSAVLFGSAHLGYLHRQKQAQQDNNSKPNIEQQLPGYDLEDETMEEEMDRE